MSNSIKRVAVIGSGVMGSQIAAHITNAGVPVTLLDIVPKDATDRNVLAKSALERMKKSENSTFMHPDNANLMSVGNLEDNLSAITEADWIVEVVLENPQVKSDIYKKIDAARKPGSIVTSNTSTIPLSILVSGQSEQFTKDFMITHFFNPVRQMRLLELITGATTRPDAIEAIKDFCDRKLGKGVVACHDTPGFIANRLGMFWLQSGLNAAIDLELEVEEADAVCGPPMGFPRTGVFGLIDLIGLDLMPLIGKSMLSTLSANDPYRNIYIEQPLCTKMIADGYTGRKGKGGFFRFVESETGKVKQAIDLKTGEYRAFHRVKNATLEAHGKNLRALCEANDKIGQYAWRVLSEVLCYAFLLIPATVEDVVAVDEAMRQGYNWTYGPFELIDRLGGQWMIDRLQKEGRPVPPMLLKAGSKSFYRIHDGRIEFLNRNDQYEEIKRPEGVLLLSDIKHTKKPVVENDSCAVWDIGEGVLCLEFHTKMCTFDNNIFQMIHKLIEMIGDGKGQWKGLVVHQEGEHFSAGADIGRFFLNPIETNQFNLLDDFIRNGQNAYKALKFAPFPTVAAPHGYAIGGGCELILHCAGIQASAESQIGLVETGIGVVPGWGGCTQMMCRAMAEAEEGKEPPITRVFDIIMKGNTTKSGIEARDRYVLRKADGVTMNRDRLLFDARQRVMDLAKDYQPPKPMNFPLPREAGIAAMELVLESKKQTQKITDFDVRLGKTLASVLCGTLTGTAEGTTEDQLMQAERIAFSDLCHTQETHDRIKYTLETGQRLHN